MAPKHRTPKKVATPGSYPAGSSSNSKVTKKKKKGVGRPTFKSKKGSVRAGNYRSKYQPEDLERAYKMVKEEGWSASGAAQHCKVPRATLADKLAGRHKTGVIGRPTVLTATEEDILAEMCVLLGLYNRPVTKRQLRNMVKSYLDKRRETSFKNNNPGRGWMRGFLARHKDRIVIRKPTNIKRSRAAVSPQEVRDYFARLEKEIRNVNSIR